MDFKLKFVLTEVQAPSAVCGSRWDELALIDLFCAIDFRLMYGDMINVVIAM